MSWPVEVEIPVQWGDQDALGHVNNVKYFRWFETARIALFERCGIAHTGTPEVGAILASTSCEFRKPVLFPGTVTACARVERVGRTSHVQHYSVRCNGEEVATGQGVVVLIDYRTGQAVEPSAEVRAALEASR